MIRIAVTTDTHYGFSQRGDKENLTMLKTLGEAKPDILIHCGDDGSHDPGNVEDYWSKVRSTSGLETTPIYVTLGNHSLWYHPSQTSFTTAQEMLDLLDSIYARNNVNHLHGKVVSLSKEVYLGSFDSWYQDTYVPTNDWRMIPGISGVMGRTEWQSLQHRSQEGFGACVASFERIKKENPESKTVLFTHMGFVSADFENDWKNQRNTEVYFGAHKVFEQFLDNVDYLFYGHSHVAFEGLALNKKTKCANIGSDYESPKYQIFEV